MRSECKEGSYGGNRIAHPGRQEREVEEHTTVVLVHGQASQLADGVQRREGLVHSDGEAGGTALQLLLDVVGLTVTFMGRKDYSISSLSRMH